MPVSAQVNVQVQFDGDFDPGSIDHQSADHHWHSVNLDGKLTLRVNKGSTLI